MARGPESTSRTSTETPPSAAKDPCRFSTTLTPCPSGSNKKSVFLFDWWLSRVENDGRGSGLAVCGLTTRGQHARRVFNSAPIVKRYDAFTLETADGVTVRIHGVINKARMHHNGFPPEVCKCFLTGFPYNWDVYVVDFPVKSPTSESLPKGSVTGVLKPSKNANTSDSTFPIHMDEFPLAKFLNVLSSDHDRETSSLSDILRRFSATNHIEKKGHNVFSLVRDEVPGENAQMEKVIALSNNFSRKSSINAKKKFDSWPKTDSAMQMKNLLQNVKEPKKSDHQCTAVQGDYDNVDQMQNVHRNLNGRDVTSMAEANLVINNVLEELDVQHLKPEEAETNVLLGKNHGSENTGTCNAESSLAQEVPGSQNDAAKSLQKPNVSNEKKTRKVGRTKRRQFLHGEKTSTLLSNGCAEVACAEKTSRNSDISMTPNVISGISAPLPDKIDDACLGIFKGNNNFSVNPVNNSTVEVGLNADETISKASEVELCLDKSPMEIEIPKTIWKDGKELEFTDGKTNIDFSELALHESVISEQKTGSSPLHLIEAQSSTGLGSSDLNMDAASATVIHKLNFTPYKRYNTRSTGGKSDYSKENSSNFGPRMLTSGTKLLNGKASDREMKNTIIEEDVRENMAASVPPNENLAQVGTDFKLESGHKHAKRISQSCGEKGSHRLNHKDGNIKQDNHGSSTPSKIQFCDGYADVTLSMGITNKSNSRISVGSSSNVASQLPVATDKDHPKDNTTVTTQGNHTKKANHRCADHSEIQVDLQSNKKRAPHAARGRTIWRPSCPPVRTPLTRHMEKRLSVASAESLNLSRSRSGRLLVPALASWRQHIVYDLDGRISGIAGVDVSNSCSIGSKSEPPGKKKKVL